MSSSGYESTQGVSPTEEPQDAIADDDENDQLSLSGRGPPFTVAEVRPGGVELIKDNFDDMWKSKDIEVDYLSKSKPDIVMTVGERRPSGEVRYTGIFGTGEPQFQ